MCDAAKSHLTTLCLAQRGLFLEWEMGNFMGVPQQIRLQLQTDGVGHVFGITLPLHSYLFELGG